jgi:hypothetical protein
MCTKNTANPIGSGAKSCSLTQTRRRLRTSIFGRQESRYIYLLAANVLLVHYIQQSA